MYIEKRRIKRESEREREREPCVQWTFIGHTAFTTFSTSAFEDTQNATTEAVEFSQPQLVEGAVVKLVASDS